MKEQVSKNILIRRPIIWSLIDLWKTCTRTLKNIFIPSVFFLPGMWVPPALPRLRTTLKKHSVRTITIDMGHGGGDPGAMGRISKEKQITLKLGRKVAEVLRSRGYKVLMTRNSDVQIPLERVCLIQNRHRSDLFISLHINAAKDRSISGIETFCLTPCCEASSNAGKPGNTNFPGNRFDENNTVLACNIQRGMLRRTGAIDRGVKRARFVVLRNINAPGVLVEAGFISSRQEELLLNDPAYLTKLANGIADGVDNYRRSVLPVSRR
jgi:N-acetylmuramoyl-L-alanine amidase